MDVLEKLRVKPRVAAIGGVALILISGAFIAFQLSGAAASKSRNQAFYTNDDGQTWFLDDARKLSPFDHEGKAAYRAIVCRAASGKLFVAYLQKFSPAQSTQIENAKSPEEADHWRLAPLDTRKPGETKWLSGAAPYSSAEGIAYRKAQEPVCPDGSATWTPVSPGDPDNGASR